MQEMILDVLKENNIHTYTICEERRESFELFFIKKNLDMKRAKDAHSGEIIVYRDFEKDGKQFRGDASCTYSPSTTKEELQQKLKRAYLAASFVPNERYEIASEVKSDRIVMKSDLTEMSMDEAATQIVNALYKKDCDPKAFINSAEVFVTRDTRHVINSNGVDVSYVKYGVNGEFVIQCKEPNDVETHQTYSFDGLETEQLEKQVEMAIQMTKDRAIATQMPKSGTYKVLLSNKYVSTVLNYYLERACGNYIYMNYSDFKIGESVQGEIDSKTETKLNMKYLPTNPFSKEGVPMKELSFIENGILQNIHVGCRFADYMKIPPTGIYGKYSCEAGTKSFEEMKKESGLYVVNFSDFQMDTMSGHFGGEIRLAYWNDGTKIIPVTGGSINGSIFDAQKSFEFSKETQSDSQMEGPYGILLKDVAVAGL